MEVDMRFLMFIFHLLLLLVCSKNTIAQNPDPMSFFPHHIGDLREYWFFERSLSFPDDTMQTEIIVDSIGSDGSTFITQIARSINPVEPPIYFFEDTAHFRIDTLQNVWGRYSEYSDTLLLLYNLNANKGDKWIILNTPWGSEMARVRNVWQEFSFGKIRTFKSYIYYGTNDTTDTLGLVRYEEILEEGIGLFARGWGDTFALVWLKGAIISDSTFGSVTTITSINDANPKLPTKTVLYPSYPNPFNSVTKIKFNLDKPASVGGSIYNLLGQEIRKIFHPKSLPPGQYESTWDGKDNSNSYASSGTYIFRLRANNQNYYQKIILVK
jgi:hypothetical protein